MAGGWGNVGSGALTGAGVGAKLGSIVPGIGTGIGAGVGAIGGGLLGLLSNMFGDVPDEYKQLSNVSPEQGQLLQQLLSQMNPSSQAGGNYQQAQNYLGQLLNRDPGVYERFAAPYMQQFEQQTVPRLAERFAGIGGGMGGGALGSSGFGQAVGGAGAQLQSQLANLYANLQQNAASQSMGQYNQLAGLGLGQRQFENLYQPGRPGVGTQLASGVAQGIGKMGGQTLLEKLMGIMGEGQDKRTGIDQVGSGSVSGFDFGANTGY